VETRALQMDLSSKSAVKKAGAEVNAYPEKHIDVLINNAGVMNLPTRMLSIDGIEMHFATNWLGHFILTDLLTDKLVAAPNGARIVNVASNGHVLSPVRFSDWNFEGKTLPEDEKPIKAALDQYGLPYSTDYLPPIAYGQSKTANILHAVELASRLKVKGISAFSLHPGGKLYPYMGWDHTIADVLTCENFSYGDRAVAKHGLCLDRRGVQDDAYENS